MKVEFLGDPVLAPTKEEEWVLHTPFCARVDGELIIVPAGYRTDLASVPRIPLAYLLFGGRARRAALLHDYLYETQAGKEYADSVFLAGMKAEGMGWLPRRTMWAAVVLFGGPIYDRKRG